MERAAKNTSSVEKNLNFFPKFYKNIINKTKKTKRLYSTNYWSYTPGYKSAYQIFRQNYNFAIIVLFLEKNARKRRDHVVLFKLPQRLAKTSSWNFL